jgi:hypothetical protein
MLRGAHCDDGLPQLDQQLAESRRMLAFVLTTDRSMILATKYRSEELDDPRTITEARALYIGRAQLVIALYMCVCGYIGLTGGPAAQI